MLNIGLYRLLLPCTHKPFKLNDQVNFKINFKVIFLTYKTLNGLAPNYFKEIIVPYCPPRPLHSQGAGLFVIPRVSKSTIGGRAFSYRATNNQHHRPHPPRKNLPIYIQEADGCNPSSSSLCISF